MDPFPGEIFVPWREKVTKIEAFFDDIKMFLPKWQNCAFNFLTLSLFLEREAWKWMFFFLWSTWLMSHQNSKDRFIQQRAIELNTELEVLQQSNSRLSKLDILDSDLNLP